MSTPPGWNASPLQGYPSKKNKFASTHLYSWVERGTESKLSFTTTQQNVPQPGLKPGTFNPEVTRQLGIPDNSSRQ